MQLKAATMNVETWTIGRHGRLLAIAMLAMTLLAGVIGAAPDADAKPDRGARVDRSVVVAPSDVVTIPGPATFGNRAIDDELGRELADDAALYVGIDSCRDAARTVIENCVVVLEGTEWSSTATAITTTPCAPGPACIAVPNRIARRDMATVAHWDGRTYIELTQAHFFEASPSAAFGLSGSATSGLSGSTPITDMRQTGTHIVAARVSPSGLDARAAIVDESDTVVWSDGFGYAAGISASCDNANQSANLAVQPLVDTAAIVLADVAAPELVHAATIEPTPCSDAGGQDQPVLPKIWGFVPGGDLLFVVGEDGGVATPFGPGVIATSMESSGGDSYTIYVTYYDEDGNVTGQYKYDIDSSGTTLWIQQADDDGVLHLTGEIDF